MIYNVLEARNNLSKLIAEAESGVEVTIARRGVPVARIVPIDVQPPRPRNAFAKWLEENPLTPELARPVEEIEAIIAENRAAGA
ncbi:MULTISPECIES: type II toxin-antitoxin system Phd/YefM family antitoxin [Microbacterium]|uniref:Antitoxin n=1 Tax=Microbacterium algihabitans TaxID=3075992 RepID=A0ABU3RTQ8_9MICO|nr:MULTISPECIES: type II toxin-antitoxin system prevent-host-death family antitoxin [Microbacterium]MCD2168452.1 type II toxin-antitoxin system prevent-host-death family antitoxin [Microbacterium sp. JC 701]MDU0326155.1 type II toxin-antitoxin system prevent-host-death family antitoxin [Microbacterium sp. KSW2-21]